MFELGSCNFLKPTIWPSHPLHAVIGQLCRGEDVGRSLNFSAKLSFLYLHTITLVTFCKGVYHQKCPWVCSFILTLLHNNTFSSTLECFFFRVALNSSPSDMVGQHASLSCLFWPPEFHLKDQKNTFYTFTFLLWMTVFWKNKQLSSKLKKFLLLHIKDYWFLGCSSHTLKWEGLNCRKKVMSYTSVHQSKFSNVF